MVNYHEQHHVYSSNSLEEPDYSNITPSKLNLSKKIEKVLKMKVDANQYDIQEVDDAR